MKNEIKNHTRRDLNSNSRGHKKPSWTLIYPDGTKSLTNFNPLKQVRRETLASFQEFYNEFDLASNCTKDDKLFKRLWRKYIQNHGQNEQNRKTNAFAGANTDSGGSDSRKGKKENTNDKIIKGMISALEDVKEGRYSVISSDDLRPHKINKTIILNDGSKIKKICAKKEMK